MNKVCETSHRADSSITVLRCNSHLRLTKSYSIVDGKIVEGGYCKAKHFGHSTHSVNNLDELFNLISTISPSQRVCVIRGSPVDGLSQSVRRTGENFPMQDAGTKLVCLDFDGIPLPDGIDPYSREAIEYAIQLLPKEFQQASYIAQFSASAGILNADGTPYKSGLRAHVFFWFNRPVTNEELKGWLFECPVDKALFTAVQPHYICNPILGDGVQCALRERLYVMDKPTDTVHAPDLSRFVRTTTSNRSPDTEWVDPPGGKPDFDDLLTCEFAEWYVSNLHHAGERYEATRAFAHNLCRVKPDNWQPRFQQLIPDDFPYTDAIISSAEKSRPISCGHIYNSVFRCPRFNPETGTCRINNYAKTPYSLALWMHRGS